MINKKQYNIIKSLDIAFETNDIYKKYHFKNDLYYYNEEKEDYHIINVVFDKERYSINENQIQKLKNKINKKKYISNHKILVIVIGNKQSPISVKKDYSILYLNYNNWNIEITKTLPSIDFNADFDFEKAYEEQKNNSGGNNEININLDSKITRKYRSFDNKRQISNLPVFIVLLIFTVIAPLLLNIVWIVHGYSASANEINNENYFLLLFGAANHDLMLALNQWWRALTYPIVNYGIPKIIINLLILLFFVRYLEIGIGHKNSFILFALYPFIGIIASMVSFSNTLSGPSIIFSLMFGAAFVAVYKKNDYTSLIIKRRILTAIVLFFIFILFFNRGLINIAFDIFSLIVGASYGLFINHNYKNKDWLIYIPIIIFSIFVLAVVAFILLGEFSNILPPRNSDVILVADTYSKIHIVSSDAVEKLNEYYTFS